MRTNPHFLAGLDAELDAELGAPRRAPPRPTLRIRPSSGSPKPSFGARRGFRSPAFRGGGSTPSFPSRASTPSTPSTPSSLSTPKSGFRPQPPKFRRQGGTTGAGAATTTPAASGTATEQQTFQQYPPQTGTQQQPGTQQPGYAPQGYAPQGYPQQSQGYPQQSADYSQQQGYPQQQPGYPQQPGYAPQSTQVQSGYQPSTPMGALEFYNESRKLRGMPVLPPDAGATDKDIANYLMQRMVGDEDRRATFEETMYAILILSAQAASRTGDAGAAQAMTQAAEQWKQLVLQNRARAKQQSAAQTYIQAAPQAPQVQQAQQQTRQPAEEQGQEGDNSGEGENKDEGETSGWGDLGDSLSPTTRTFVTVLGAFGLAWGGLCLWRNSKKKKG